MEKDYMTKLSEELDLLDRCKWIYKRNGEVRAVFNNQEEAIIFATNMLLKLIREIKQSKGTEILIPEQEFKRVLNQDA